MTTTPKPGRPRLKPADFPPDTNWKLPAYRLARNLGVCWKIADRLRTEALAATDYKPVVHAQPSLPGFGKGRLMPDKFDTVDWTENASLLANHLGLDKGRVLRLKSLARRERRVKQR